MSLENNNPDIQIKNQSIGKNLIVKSPKWPEPLEIKFIENIGNNYIRIFGVTIN